MGRNAQPTAHREKLWSASFILITVVSLFAAMTGNGLQNGVTVLVEQLGGSASLSGTIAGLFSFSALAMRFVSGSLSDKRGRKFVMLIGAVLLLAGCLISLIFSNIYLLIPSRILMGFGLGMTLTPAAAAVSDIVPRERMGEGLGYQGFAAALSMALGPSLSVLLVSLGGRVPLFASYCLISAATLFLILVCKFTASQTVHNSSGSGNAPLAHSAEKSEEEAPQNAIAAFFLAHIEAKAIPPAVVTVFFCTAHSLFMLFMALFAQRYSLGFEAGYFFVAAGASLAVRLFFSKAIDRFPVNTLLVPSLIIGLLAALFPLLFKTTWALVLSGVLYGTSLGFSDPLATTESIRRAPENRRGAASATYFIAMDIGIGGGSFLWGFTIESFGFDVTFILNMICMLISILLSVVLLSKKKTRLTKG